MCGRRTLGMVMAILSIVTGGANAQHHGVHHTSWHGWHGGSYHAASGGYFGTGAIAVAGGGFYGYFPPILALGPAAFMPPVGWMNPTIMPGAGPLLPPPPPGILDRRPNAGQGNQNGDPTRSGQLTTLGDRLFRAGNLKKAEDRYLQAMRAAPDRAAPRVRLAQVALVRGHYDLAANRIREAETAEPGWLITAPDIETLYAEPTDFANTLARLESHLQIHPDDRDAWLVLGAEWFLSGRTAKAADVFKRLNDPNRKSDIALSAFLDASNQAAFKMPEPPVPVEPAKYMPVTVGTIGHPPEGGVLC
jgi:hypothetical protein